MTTRSGQSIRVSEDRVASWEARGYVRADQPAETKKAPAKKAPAKRTAKKSTSKK